ncbi:MAG TPA: phospholipid carrier-dependent glycosyltransferase [Candidatus Paceibacterota bacterium]|jgi:4-amino-4-deoxy-L-arabinose transferase-like glycosyltransferase|nr:phospholipid carrier-dependent glycosyltransferase [Candidatus Paceibacterota bacterium]
MTKKTRIALLVLCALSFALMWGSAQGESAVVDELAHIPAGYAYITRFDYRLNPEHPPLLKALAAVPLLFLHLQFPDTNSFWTTSVNGEWGVGGAFLFGLGNSASAIIGWARLFPMLLTLGLILLTYFWAAKLFGYTWAFLPATMVGLSPVILANGHYVTTDIAAAFGAVFGLFCFVRFMQKPGAKNLFIAGIGLGIAQVMKFSDLILIPVIAILLLFDFLGTVVRDWKKDPFAAQRARSFFRRLLKYIGYFLLIGVIGYAVIVYPLYAIFTAGYPPARQLSDTVSIVGGIASGTCEPTHPVTCLAKLDIKAAGNPLTRPMAEYLLGEIMDFERLTGGNTSYFLGKVYSYGTHLYFPVVYALKETLPVLILLVLAAILALARIIAVILKRKSRFWSYIREEFPQFAMFVFVVVYWGISIESTLNIGVRHLLPTIPLMYVLATSSLRRWFAPRAGAAAGNGSKFSWKGAFVGAMLVWSLGETAFAYPHFLSYFNELGDGTENGYRYVTDSNYDWGQDMLALQAWMNQNPQVNQLALDFFGGSNPAYYLGNKYVAWNSSMGNPASQGIEYFAVSINNLQDAIQPAAPGYARDPSDEYSWLTAFRAPAPGMGGVPPPDYRVGTTIFIYKLY